MGSVQRIGTAAIAFLLAACGTTSVAAPSPASPLTARPLAERLIVESDAAGKDATKVIEVATGRVAATLPGGAVSPTLDMVVATGHATGATDVLGVGLDGTTRFHVSVPGEFTFPNAYGAAPSGFSPNGKWLVLVSRDGTESRFAVVDIAHGSLARTVALSSRFTFDAIHDGGGAMYLIEHPNAGSTAYNVRFYDLQANVLKPDIIFDKAAIAQYDPAVGLMDGTFHVSVAPKDGDWTFGLYMRPNGAPFVHALNVPGRFAQCIIGISGKWTASSMFSMALSDDGRSLYVVDTVGGTVSVIDALSQKIRAKASFTAGGVPGDPRRAAAAISHDGSRIYASGPNGIAMLQVSDLTLRGWLVPDLPVRSLAISADNARLYALAGDSVRLIDIASGKIAATLATVPGARAVHLVPAH